MPSGLCSIQYPACWEHACHLPPTSEVLEFLPEEQTQSCVLHAEQIKHKIINNASAHLADVF